MSLNFYKDGVEIRPFLDTSSFTFVKNKLQSYIVSSLRATSDCKIDTYHLWGHSYDQFRNSTLSANTRHFPTEFWSDICLIESLSSYIYDFLPSYKLTLWDEGLGTSAFRLVRPGFEDGYPPSRKSWGPGGNLISVTIPLIGFTKFESQAFLLGSHLLDYPSYVPTTQKFCSDEKRLLNPSSYNFSYFASNPGDIIIYHWNTVHSEQIIGSNTTRLALEVRFVCHD